MSERPTARLNIVWPEGVDLNDPDPAAAESLRQIRTFAAELRATGERPWFEVWYPAPSHLSPAERVAWEARQADTFDAVEVADDGTVTTLPPYSELVAS